MLASALKGMLPLVCKVHRGGGGKERSRVPHGQLMTTLVMHSESKQVGPYRWFVLEPKSEIAAGCVADREGLCSCGNSRGACAIIKETCTRNTVHTRRGGGVCQGTVAAPNLTWDSYLTTVDSWTRCRSRTLCTASACGETSFHTEGGDSASVGFAAAEAAAEAAPTTRTATCM